MHEGFPSICFVSLNSYGILSKKEEIKHIGGAEIQQDLMARYLARKGYKVSFITLDHGQSDEEMHDGITVFKSFKKEKGFPLIRFIQPRMTGIIRALVKANCDVYYQRGGDVTTAHVALWCKIFGKGFVFGISNDSICRKELIYLPFREKIFYRLGIIFADRIVAQTRKQKYLLEKNFKLSSIVIGSIAPLSKINRKIERKDENEPIKVLWVGRICPEKRFDWLLFVAEKCPEMEFHVVGEANYKNQYSSKMAKRALKIPNVFMHGYKSHYKMSEFYFKSDFLCCTSIHEGFPNTFLEAWNIGLPVITTFDPDGIIAREGIGIVVGDISQMISCLRKFSNSLEILKNYSYKAKAFFIKKHLAEVNMPKFEKVILLAQKNKNG